MYIAYIRLELLSQGALSPMDYDDNDNYDDNNADETRSTTFRRKERLSPTRYNTCLKNERAQNVSSSSLSIPAKQGRSKTIVYVSFSTATFVVAHTHIVGSAAPVTIGD